MSDKATIEYELFTSVRLRDLSTGTIVDRMGPDYIVDIGKDSSDWDSITVSPDGIIEYALQNVSKVRYYGISMLVDILRGADNKHIFDNKLDKIPEFGLYKEMPRETIQSIIEWMIKEKLILKTKERYPVLHSTDEGLHYNEHVTVNKLRQLKKYLEEEVVLWK